VVVWCNTHVKPSTDYGLEELLACAKDAPEAWVKTVQNRLRDWYFKHTRLETIEHTLSANPSEMEEYLARMGLRTGFGGYLMDGGVATHQVESFTERTIHSIEVRVVLPKATVSDTDGVQIARTLWSSRRPQQPG
jgi:hypothetical protein